jgi:hypothetical protein
MLINFKQISRQFAPSTNVDPNLLLHPNIPKPLHKCNPRSVLGQDWWDEQRQFAYSKASYHCEACGVHKRMAKYHDWLEAHEIYDIDYRKGTATFVRLAALCHSCHNYIHSGRMQALVNKKQFAAEKQQYILERGDKLTKGLRRPPEPSYVAPWDQWKLIVEGIEYERYFNTYEDWCKYYGYETRRKRTYFSAYDSNFDSDFESDFDPEF